MFKNKDWSIVFYPLDLTDEDPRFEQEEISFPGLSFNGDSEPVVCEETSELVDIPSITLDARYEFIICGAVGDAEEEFESVL